MRFGWLFALVTLVSSAAGCATVTRGATQTIAIDTDPAGADCTFAQNGKEVATLTATPGSVVVDRRQAPLDVSCRLPGYREEQRQLPSNGKARDLLEEEGPELNAEDRAAAAGYAGAQVVSAAAPPIVAGQITSLAAVGTLFAPVAIASIVLLPAIALVDAATGAAYQYKPFLRLTLSPSSFDSMTARDAFYAQRRSELEQRAARVRSTILDRCSRIHCPTMVAEVDAQLAARQAELDRQAAAAVVPLPE